MSGPSYAAFGRWVVPWSSACRPNQTWPGVPGEADNLFIAGSLGVVANQVALQPLDSAVGLGFVLLGLPVYFFWEARRADRRHP